MLYESLIFDKGPCPATVLPYMLLLPSFQPQASQKTDLLSR